MSREKGTGEEGEGEEGDEEEEEGDEEVEGRRGIELRKNPIKGHCKPNLDAYYHAKGDS